ISVSAVSLGDFSVPVIDTRDETQNLYVAVNNLGSNPVTSVDYAYSFDGENFVTGKIETNIEPSSENYFVIPASTSVTGRGELTVRINSINDVEYSSVNTLPYIAIDNDGYHRNFVVEEGTGTGCGYCPRGIVGMESMAEAYPETFIGIAVHGDWFGSDPMTVASYQPLLEYYFTGFPSCIVNRDPIFIVDPSAEYLQAVYEFWASQAGAAEIGLNVIKPAEDASAIEVEASTTFAYDDADAKYALAFVIIEDGLKGIQTNYFAGQPGAMGGWGSKPQRVTWTYSDTARDIFDVWGIGGSVPSSVKKAIAYDYKYSLDMKNVKNIENTSVVAMLIDNETGVIINAKKVAYADYSASNGIADIATDATAPAEYYNIQGVRMDADNLPAGLYIIRQGDKVQKTIIR
ncbi:MAG: Omp28-related outer membrane protein, partial [Muribaculaceae bacterium]|nr:Omp28-related outer membrane protein [Muribaculaceae bacterium]